MFELNFHEIVLNWIICWRNSNIELNRFGYRSPLGSARSFYMRKYDKAFVIATSCILKHSSLQNENEVSGVNIKVFLCVINFLEKALSWNVQTPPEKRNLLGWTLIGTRKTLHPFPVSLRVIWVLFDTELPVWSWSYWWRLAFVIQKALAGDENVNIRQSQKPNLLRPYWKLQHSISVLQ